MSFFLVFYQTQFSQCYEQKMQLLGPVVHQTVLSEYSFVVFWLGRGEVDYMSRKEYEVAVKHSQIDAITGLYL